MQISGKESVFSSSIFLFFRENKQRILIRRDLLENVASSTRFYCSAILMKQFLPKRVGLITRYYNDDAVSEGSFWGIGISDSNLRRPLKYEWKSFIKTSVHVDDNL